MIVTRYFWPFATELRTVNDRWRAVISSPAYNFGVHLTTALQSILDDILQSPHKKEVQMQGFSVPFFITYGLDIDISG